jgi:hypothetical protein
VTDRGQATVEYAGLVLLLAALVLGATVAARAALDDRPREDAAALTLAAQHVPRFIAERGDGEQPVDFRRCRRPACARSARPVLYVHAVQANGFTYLEYWEYLPDSRTAHTGIAAFDGYHHDDWEGVIVKLRADGAEVGARASAHLGWAGRHPWWQLAANDWAPDAQGVYRASGSHAGSFRSQSIDLAGDRWNGNAAASPPPLLLAADRARIGAPAFDLAATPPWQKQAWSDPETVITGPPGSQARYARYARWWATLCLPC